LTLTKPQIYLPLRRQPSFSGRAEVGSIGTGRNWVAESSGVLCCFQARRASMSIYFQKGRGYKYDFTLNGQRHTSKYFETKKEAKQEEAKRREEILNPPKETEMPTDMGFLELVNLRLDHVKAFNSVKHYRDYFYMARRWVKDWGHMPCSQITQQTIQRFIFSRMKVSQFTANKEIRYLRATFNFGKKKRYIGSNPVDGMDFLPVEKRVKYVPPASEIDKVIEAADLDTQDYLWTLRETLGRMSEVNRLTWDDVNIDQRYVILYTRKKKGGHLTPRKVPMTQRLFEILSKRYQNRDPDKPWVFWHTYVSSKTGELCLGPYQERKRFMKTLCQKVGVKYFRFHALRHSGASLMDNNNVPLAAIQKILGHENRSTTELYLHSIGDLERQAMSAYESARQNSHSESHSELKKGLTRVSLTH
jgi:integrase